jgi:hypothetical protein
MVYLMAQYCTIDQLRKATECQAMLPSEMLHGSSEDESLTCAGIDDACQKPLTLALGPGVGRTPAIAPVRVPHAKSLAAL